MDPEDRERHESRYAAKLPFTEGMLERCRNANFVNLSATTLDKMAYVAIALALHIGNRPGEVSSNGPLEVDEDGISDRDHRFTTKDILFQRERDMVMMEAMEITQENKNEVHHISVMVDTHKGERKGKRQKVQREPNAVRRDGGGWESILFHDMRMGANSETA